MFTEKDLIRKIRKNNGINLGNNQKNNFQRECYCKKNSELHKKDTFFDLARRTNLAETYFGSPKDSSNHLLNHTKKPDEANLMKTYNTISQNIAALHDIGNRNWSTADIKVEHALSQVDFHKPSTAMTDVRPPTIKSFGGPIPRCQRLASAGNMVRIYSAKDSAYIDAPVKQENDSLKLTYMAMKSTHNANSFQVCGSRTATNAGKAFEICVDPMVNTKPYTVSAETFHSSWIDRGRPQTTTNYESSRFDIISHTNGKNGSITRMIQENPKACYKVKGIAEYCDLARVSAIKQNREYQDKIKSNPMCFLKAGTLCASQCDMGKTYGPFYKLFKK